MAVLTAEQVKQYNFDGYRFPFPALSQTEVGERQADYRRYETWLQKPLPQADLKWRGLTFIFLPWVDRLVRDPRILDAVESVIGPDILVYMATFFVKEANSPAITAWHQDATYFGLTPHEHVTAWLAITDASGEAGCMDVVSSKGSPRQLHHAERNIPHSINSRAQTIVEDFDQSRIVTMDLRAGEFSLHHTLCVHRSGPNRTQDRRIGLGISYIPTRVRHTGSRRMHALLVRGEDRFGHFDLLPAPTAECDPASIALHQKVYTVYRQNYEDQSQAHAMQFQ